MPVVSGSVPTESRGGYSSAINVDCEIQMKKMLLWFNLKLYVAHLFSQSALKAMAAIVTLLLNLKLPWISVCIFIALL